MLSNDVLYLILGIVIGTLIHIAAFQLNRTITLKRLEGEICELELHESGVDPYVEELEAKLALFRSFALWLTPCEYSDIPDDKKPSYIAIGRQARKLLGWTEAQACVCGPGDTCDEGADL